MPLEISEDLVSLAYQSLGYFVMEGQIVGHQEIDLLAVRLDENGQVDDRLHVEVSVSTNPAGVLRGSASLKRAGRDHASHALDWVRRKFLQPAVEATAQKALGAKDYRRVFVYGRLNDETQLEAITAAGVECVPIGDLVARAMAEPGRNRLARAVGVATLAVGRPQEGG